MRAMPPTAGLTNVTGTGNTLDFARPEVRDLTLATLRHFAAGCGVDGFRFDLAPVLARGPGLRPQRPDLCRDCRRSPARRPRDDRRAVGSVRRLCSSGNFPENWLEWNDRYRDDVRRFWRGDGDGRGRSPPASPARPTSSTAQTATRSVSFLAAHDGFTLADTVAYAERHNHGQRRGQSRRPCARTSAGTTAPKDPDRRPRRASAAAPLIRALLLATLFATKGTIMLTAGDEFGRTQSGNNNAYAQDNAVTWLDWEGRDTALEDFVAALAAFRAREPLRRSRLPRGRRLARPRGPPARRRRAGPTRKASSSASPMATPRSSSASIVPADACHPRRARKCLESR